MKELPPVFESLAYLYGPADPRHGVKVVEAGDDWSVPAAPGPEVDVLLWGRMHLNQRPSPVQLVGAIRRDAAIARLRARPPRGLRVAAVHRLSPVRRPGRLRGVIRTAVLGGALVELVRKARPLRVIDSVAAAAGAVSLGSGLRASGDGSALGRMQAADGTSAELRVVRVGHPKDLLRGRAALLALEAGGVPLVPRSIAGGQMAGAVWTTETVLAGVHVPRLTADVIRQVTDLCVSLPMASIPPSAIREQLDELALHFPLYKTALADVVATADTWIAGQPGVMQHGDLWLNNLLVRGHDLSGVVDWDTWHPAGVPGADVLNLLAAEERTSSGRDIGPLLTDDHWRSPDVVAALIPYFRGRGLAFPDERGLAAIAVGWWASRITDALYRGGRPAADPAWVQRNIAAVLDRLTDLGTELR